MEKALVVFWKNGYHASSITELTQAMGINKPSLYAAYGDKEALYLRALALYKERWVARHMQALDTKEDPVEAVLAFLRSVVTMLTDPQLPDGCFVVNGVTGCGSVAMSS
ncbi:MAG: TetR/AcrR family transcriptional regulator, partial [Burkholderiaceae bacterium]